MHHHDQAIAALPAKLILALHMKLIHPQARPPTKLDHIWMLPQARPRPATTSSGLLLCPSSTAMISSSSSCRPPSSFSLQSIIKSSLPSSFGLLLCPSSTGLLISTPPRACCRATPRVRYIPLLCKFGDVQVVLCSVPNVAILLCVMSRKFLCIALYKFCYVQKIAMYSTSINFTMSKKLLCIAILLTLLCKHFYNFSFSRILLCI